MRLMLGRNNKPELLVSVTKYIDSDPHVFEFYVVNGAWKGRYERGTVVVFLNSKHEQSEVNNVDIMCCNQDRLRGDYQTVFENYDNVNYCAPKFEIPDSWKDDIPF